MVLRRISARLKLGFALVVMTLAPAQAFETQARAAWVYDVTTHTVLLDKNATEALPPASMSKLMTINMMFEALKSGRMQLTDTFSVSEKAWKMGGSKMFVKPGDRPTIEELLHGIIINSGNDACVVVAEGMAGTEEAFARLMTERAHELGMANSTFANASGWPNPDHRMSVQDLGILAVRLIEEFPEYYPMFGMTGFVYKDRVPSNSENRNPLLRIKGGDWQADGLKTGHTEEAGYGLVGSAVKNDGRRVVFVITGLPSDAARAQESEAIVNWAFRQFAAKTVVRQGIRVAEAEVFMGEAATVGLTPAKDLTLLLPTMGQTAIDANVVYKGPIPAPIEAGQQLAELILRIPGLPEHRVPLVAETPVQKAGFMRRLSVTSGILWKTYVAGDAAQAS
ncbi:D-alanyl-D-alanine carboxypeptidase [Xinfangfangia sp. D13-10-4-6]|uniref:D-alanyl-D-alanine carboxypeptidase family protein n=1 Tax=Pseudogemmobacter hezensis TaxID=2737662 RepID=UPI001554EEB3|nr:D-alanyl-D-alanine carboxypeptidase family protein [Pseudogemmobacter hezensis]NPD13677.1 D-alanyl-D-alanine carboxypeptidase [Pseudogemmobacter hezensis]